MMNAKPLRLFLGFGIVLIPVVCSAADAISFSTLVTNAMDAMRKGARRPLSLGVPPCLAITMLLA